MSLPQVFSFESQQVRTLIINGEPWWVAADVCAVLGITKYRDAVARLEEDEAGSLLVDTLGGPQEMAAINEAGLFSLILRSRKPEAKTFKRWVTHEVLPQIRQTGSYQPKTEFILPHDFKSALLALVSEVDARERLEEQTKALEAKVEADKPKVEFAEQVGSAINSMSVANAAKVLGTGEIRLFNWLRKNKILMQGGDQHNRPYQQYLDQGHFKVVERPWKSPSGEVMKSEKTLITSKGLIYIWKKMRSQNEPVCPEPPTTDFLSIA